jgi:lipopolysaccharide export system permease protein
VFIEAFKDHTIYVRKKDDKTGLIEDVQIFRYSKPGALPTTIIADRGKLTYLEAQNVLRFELEDGHIHEMPEGNDPSTYRRTDFKHYVINITDIDRSLQRSEREYRGDREMSVAMMRDKIKTLHKDIAGVDVKMADLASSQVKTMFTILNPAVRDTLFTKWDSAMPRPKTFGLTSSSRSSAIPQSKAAVTERALASQHEIKVSYFRQIDRYRVEIHKKFSIPFACIVFVLIGSPIALRLGRSGMNMAIGLSILVFLVYYICLIGGEKLADRQVVGPVIAMWVPNIIFGGIGLLLIRKASQEQSAIHWKRYLPFKFARKSHDLQDSRSLPA